MNGQRSVVARWLACAVLVVPGFVVAQSLPVTLPVALAAWLWPPRNSYLARQPEAVTRRPALPPERVSRPARPTGLESTV